MGQTGFEISIGLRFGHLATCSQHNPKRATSITFIVHQTDKAVWMKKDFAVLCFPNPTKVRGLLMPIASRLGCFWQIRCFWQTLQEDLGLQPQTTPENWANCLPPPLFLILIKTNIHSLIESFTHFCCKNVTSRQSTRNPGPGLG